MIAFEFVPCQSAGVQRPSVFAHYLQQHNWRPIIITAENSAHPRIDQSVVLPVPRKDVYPVAAPDAKQAFGFRNKYFELTTTPDRWWLWALKAIKQGKKLIDRYQPDMIWSTHPIVSSHFVGLKLSDYAKRKNPECRWIADYRDPMKCQYEPEAIAYPFVSRWIDNKVIDRADAAVFVTTQSKKLYANNYSDQQHKFHVIENGYDEKNFTLAAPLIKKRTKDPRFTILHSGALFPTHARNPQHVFVAISHLKQSGIINAANFVLKFRGCPNGNSFSESLNALNIVDLVEFLPNITYLESLAEMQLADILLAIQGELFDKQIPGKVYEYIRANKPIIALTGQHSATGELVKSIPFGYVVAGHQSLQSIISNLLYSTGGVSFDYGQYSRENRSEQLNQLLNSLKP